MADHNNKLDAIEKTQPDTATLVAELRPLAQQYQFEAMSQLLSSGLQETLNTGQAMPPTVQPNPVRAEPNSVRAEPVEASPTLRQAQGERGDFSAETNHQAPA